MRYKERLIEALIIFIVLILFYFSWSPFIAKPVSQDLTNWRDLSNQCEEAVARTTRYLDICRTRLRECQEDNE